jgi:hypothetical protein
MVRHLRHGVLIAAALFFALPFGSAHADQQPGLDLSVATQKARYAPGERLALTATVTNRGAAPCQLAALPEATVQLTSAAVDGKKLFPVFGRTTYELGIDTAVRGSLKTVAPGESVSFPLDGGPGWLSATNALPGGDGMSAAWLLKDSGDYTVSALYRSPVLADVQPATCSGMSAPTKVTFAVGEERALDGLPWWVWAVGGGGLLLLVVLIVVVARRGRGAAAALLAFVVVAGMATVDTRTARAEINFDDSGDTAYQGAIGGCLDTIASMGGEFKSLVDKVRDPNSPRITFFHNKGPGETNSDESWFAKKGSKVIDFDPDYKATYEDPFDPGHRAQATVERDACATLFHELYHATAAGADPANSTTWCGDSGLHKDEVLTIQAENRYRAARRAQAIAAGQPGAATDPKTQERTYHSPYKASPQTDKGTGVVPKSADDCKDGDPPGSTRQGGGCSAGPSAKFAGTPLLDLSGFGRKAPQEGGKCAISDGDPHLTTFDKYNYDFQAAGEFVSVRSATGDLEVQVRQSALPDDRTVSVNTAVAAKVGADKIGFSMDGGVIAAKVNGQAVTPNTGDTPLPGGGVLTRSPAPAEYSGDAYTLRWPDGSMIDLEPIAPWGIRLSSSLADARKGQVTGLLGDFDGNRENDLTPKGGQPLPQPPSFEQRYREFGDSWRITQAESLFDYAQGQNTDTFTDRTMPERETKVPDEQRAAATTACRLAGVTAADLLEQCVLDTALTGQPVFAIGTADTQRALSAPTKPTHPTDPPKQGGTLRDGDTASGTGGHGVFDLELGDAKEFRLVGVTGQIFFQLIDPDGAAHRSTGSTLPGSNGFRIPQPGHYRLEVDGADGFTGNFGFRLVTLKFRKLSAKIGDQVSGTADVPGRVDVYSFDPAGAEDVELANPEHCEKFQSGVVPDEPEVSVLAPRDLCGEVSLPVSDPARPHVLVIWSDEAATGPYSFRLTKS